MINVLIIDDDPMVAELNRLFLSRLAGFCCCGIAPTLGEARHIISERPQGIDLILLDVYMHKENGLDLLPTLRREEHDIDVIMITSAADAATVQSAIGYGVVDYLIKPFQFSRFEEALTAWSHKRSLRRAISCYQQSDIDDLLNRAARQHAESRRLPKGLTAETLRTVCRWIGDHPDAEFSTNELAAQLDISRVSCRKYLLWLAQIDILHMSNHYGATGRPEYRYRLIVEHDSLLKQFSH
ncbi:two-component system response regulator DcuR [Klebsiella sp. WOUb02]|uniref:two-component system response regulator DcuR n=1 Tax=Klebsiella sp. WOUb02 TaxID=3161071 RepID=UPI003CE6A560